MYFTIHYTDSVTKAKKTQSVRVLANPLDEGFRDAMAELLYLKVGKSNVLKIDKIVLNRNH